MMSNMINIQASSDLQIFADGSWWPNNVWNSKKAKRNIDTITLEEWREGLSIVETHYLGSLVGVDLILLAHGITEENRFNEAHLREKARIHAEYDINEAKSIKNIEKNEES